MTIDLDQHKTRRVILLLYNVEARNSGFLAAVTGIFKRGGFEGFDLVGFHLDHNLNDEHDYPFLFALRLFPPGPAQVMSTHRPL
jgi:hypothetical protein